MSVIYRGKKPDRNYTVNDFYNNGVVISWFAKFRMYTGENCIRCIFRSNGLLGEIRSCGNTFAVDVMSGWSTSLHNCLTTECKSVREAKFILFEWFKSQGFRKSDAQLDYGTYLAFDSTQLNLNPFIFK